MENFEQDYVGDNFCNHDGTIYWTPDNSGYRCANCGRAFVTDLELKAVQDESKRLKELLIRRERPAILRVVEERARQDAKWGEQNHEAGKWSLILAEELGEVAKSQLEGDRANYLTELIQSAAVLVAWLECELRKES